MHMNSNDRSEIASAFVSQSAGWFSPTQSHDARIAIVVDVLSLPSGATAPMYASEFVHNVRLFAAGFLAGRK